MKLITMPNRSTTFAGVLPQVWAADGNLALAVSTMRAETAPGNPEVPVPLTGLRAVITPETSFYRKYTEAMLRRYGVMRLQKGRVPSLLGREMFRGAVTSYRMNGFDDVVIFVHDVERCLRLLDGAQQKLVYRIGVQEYTFGETASLLAWSLRSTQRRYNDAIDALTAIFQQRGLMEKTPGLKMQVRRPEPKAAGAAEQCGPPSESAR